MRCRTIVCISVRETGGTDNTNTVFNQLCDRRVIANTFAEIVTPPFIAQVVTRIQESFVALMPLQAPEAPGLLPLIYPG